MNYALGRGLEYYDAESVDQILERLEKENGRVSALVMGIIESAPFQKRRNNYAASTDADGSSAPASDIALKPSNRRTL